jgi:FkbM family methyltransferase
MGETRRIILSTFLYGFVRPLWSLMPDFSRFTWVTLVGNNLISFRPLVMHDFVFVLANKDHEPYVQKIFHPKPGETVVDVGAHIGLYTLRVAREVGPKGKVIAIEPDPRNFVLLKQNIATNNLHNVIAVNVALSDDACRRLFYACTDPSLSSLKLQSQTKIREAKIVTTMTLSALLKNLDIKRVDWIKVDVEGEELEVLRGGMLFLQNIKNVVIIIESSNTHATEYLREMGFHTEHLGETYYLAFHDQPFVQERL